MDGLKTTQAERSEWREIRRTQLSNEDRDRVLDDLDTALARVAELEALLGQARDALEPFGIVGSYRVSNYLGDDWAFVVEPTTDASNEDFKAGDLRTAARVHAALSEELAQDAQDTARPASAEAS